MYKKIFITIIVLFAIGLAGCTMSGNNTGTSSDESATGDTYRSIQPEEAKQRLDADADIVLLDVRTQEEYDEKHIPGSILIPVDVLGKEAAERLKDRNAMIFVYCRSGRRSAIAAETLSGLGYTDVYDMGGINNWTYETESGKPK